MKKRNFLAQSLLPIVITGLLLSCGNSTPSQTDEQLKLDSLNSLAKKQQVHIGEMEEFITSLSLTMDSINMQEKELVGEGDLEKKKKTSKETIIKNLREYKELIKRQRQKIASLEKQLSAKNDEMSSKMLQIVTFYRKELEAKDKTIASLQMDIEKNKKVIKNLQTSIGELTATTEQQAKVIKEQEGVMDNQTNMINTCYVKMGTKKELKNAGLISGGFLKKTKLETSMLTPSNFIEMDMRKCNDLVIASKNPTILTQMPASSYEIIKKDDGTCYLHIKDPNAFWSISRYLVIKL